MQAITLADQVYEQLHSDIVMGKLPPHGILLEENLANSMQVSRTPVREALLRLAKDGLVESTSRRWCVVQPRIDDIAEIYEVRAALEGYAARLATERATDERLAAIEAALATREEAGPSVEEFVTTNAQFHRAIVEASGNARLLDATERNKHYYFNAQSARLYTKSDLKTSHQEHRDLLQAIVDRDADRAERISRDHIQRALRLLQERLG